MKSGYIYPIGTPGQPWSEEERKAWLATQEVKRSYQDEVVSKIDALRERFDVEQYGALSYNEARFPLFCIKTCNWDSTKPIVLVTGGVHGYETSGIHGALKFVETEAERYAEHFNIVVAPCVSPWGYEVINRWNPNAIDPNRSFYEDSPAEESANLMKLVATLGDVLMHFDLHETTDSDETEFRPALAARDGIEYIEGMIPDGFYTVGDSENPQPEFQKAVIESVAKVTHIAPADENGEIIGSPVVQFGVINYPMVKLGLCGGVTNCVYGTTTEVYPDSPTVTDEECNDAQVAAVVGGLNYVLAQL
ncbi:M14 family metallocarboxypeptidase [Vibrio antiquarius]|uniref:M14 family metallopeptidase n=1 Tax=Vibrio diabolicus subgroup TaxID=2315253 RepID=UPI000DF12159|nr:MULTISPECIES: M14 family metallocarboxypeptidase [Vibrio diabolicus subgroup]MCG6224371.1 M14 family metallocarboxypeptidase [Vibrio diabolicus]MCR9686942.1 M14 family metallocarboxypeptidase [Vibrio antiquarius]RCW25432.1 zinc carboxypeptidase [Vibrio parahaemolyticus]